MVRRLGSSVLELDMKKWDDGRLGKPTFPGSVEDNRSGRAQVCFLAGRLFGI